MKSKTLKITILTLFPDFLQAYTRFGIIRKAIKNKLLKFTAVNLRRFAQDKRGTVDGRPYGGGVGMVLRPDVVIRAIGGAKNFKFQISNFKKNPKLKSLSRKLRIILLTPQGKTFQQADARRLAKYEHLIFISGRYEGFDERVRKFVDEEISIGDYVLMGGELPALAVSEAILRLIPGVLGKYESTRDESFASRLLEYPQYTKPEVLEFPISNLSAEALAQVDFQFPNKSKIPALPAGRKNQKSKILRMRVPKILLSGNHQKIKAWRTQEAVKRTKKRRPDLLK